LTTVATQTETPDDLSATLNKTSDALSAITAQIADLQVQIRRRHERLDELEVDTLEHSRRVAQLREQVDQAEEKLSRARIAAGIARGGRSEKATAANVKMLQAELAALQQEFTEAQQAYSTQNTQTRIESDDINKQLAQDEIDLAALEQTRGELKQERTEIRKKLGQATYEALASELRGLLETEKDLEKALADHRTKRLAAQQEGIALRLADWPELAGRLEEELSPTEKQKPEVAPSIKFAQRMLKSLDALQELKEHSMRMGYPAIESTLNIDARVALRRLALQEDFIHLVLTSVQGLHLIEQRQYEVREYVREAEQQARDRQFYRELGLYNRSR